MYNYRNICHTNCMYSIVLCNAYYLWGFECGGVCMQCMYVCVYEARYKTVQVHGSALSAFMHKNLVCVSVNMFHIHNLHTLVWFSYNISIA